MNEETGARQVVDDFVAAWLRGDLEGVMACVTDDVVFSPSGSGLLETFRGEAAVRAEFAESIGPDAEITLGEPVVMGDTVLGPWWYPPRDDGSSLRGIDVYTMRDGKIAAKDVFSKTTAA